MASNLVQGHIQHPQYPTQSVKIRNRQPIHNFHLPSQLVQRDLRVLGPQFARLSIRHKHKVIREQRMALWHIILLRDLSISLADINSQGIFDAKDSVRGFIGVAAEV